MVAQTFFDRPEFDRDVKRIEAYYADRGYPRAKVVGVDVELNDAKDKAAITVDINEGEPTIVEAVILDGFAIPADHLERLKARLPIAEGKPRDQRSSWRRTTCRRRAARSRVPVRQCAGRRTAGFDRDPRGADDCGRDRPQAVFGAITVEGDVSVDEDVIRRELAFREGDLYQLSRITETATHLQPRAVSVRQRRAAAARRSRAASAGSGHGD